MSETVKEEDVPVEEDIQQFNGRERRQVQDRDLWKGIVRAARAIQGL